MPEKFMTSAGTDLCGLCRGQGWLLRTSNGQRWFACPSCNGVGTMGCFAGPTVRVHVAPSKELRRLNKKLDKEWV